MHGLSPAKKWHRQRRGYTPNLKRRSTKSRRAYHNWPRKLRGACCMRRRCRVVLERRDEPQLENRWTDSSIGNDVHGSGGDFAGGGRRRKRGGRPGRKYIQVDSLRDFGSVAVLGIREIAATVVSRERRAD